MALLLAKLFGGNPSHHYLAIDLGSNTTIRSLGFDCDNSSCTALPKRHFELPRPESENEADLISAVREYLHRLIFQYLKNIGRVPTAVLIGLGNHFTVNEIATSRQVRPHPDKPLRLKELQEMLNDFLKGQKEKLIAEKRYQLMHLMPFRLELDGYGLESVSSRTRGKNIEIVLFAAYVQKEFAKVLNELRSLWGGLELAFTSDQAAVAAALISGLGIKDALIAKIGAKITEVSLLDQGAIRFTGRFEKGGDDFTRALAGELGVKFGDAERIKRQWGRTRLPTRTAQIAGRALGRAIEEWLAEFAEFLKRDEHPLLPERIYIFGGGARLQPLLEAVASQPWYSRLTILEKLDVRPLLAEDFSQSLFRNSSPALSGPEETALAALASRLNPFG